MLKICEQFAFLVAYTLSGLPDIGKLLKTNRHLLSHISDGKEVIQENADYCVGLAKHDSPWALSLSGIQTYWN